MISPKLQFDWTSKDDRSFLSQSSSSSTKISVLSLARETRDAQWILCQAWHSSGRTMDNTWPTTSQCPQFSPWRFGMRPTFWDNVGGRLSDRDRAWPFQDRELLWVAVLRTGTALCGDRLRCNDPHVCGTSEKNHVKKLKNVRLLISTWQKVSSDYRAAEWKAKRKTLMAAIWKGLFKLSRRARNGVRAEREQQGRTWCGKIIKEIINV